jgi:hypothetical protein
MRHCLPSLLALFCAAPVFAGGNAGKIVLETWDAAYLGEGKAGYLHTVTREFDQAGTKLLHTTLELRLTVKRFSDTIQMAMDTGSIETADGKVVGVFMKQYQAKNQTLQIDGKVVGKQIQLTLNGKQPLNPAPWNPEVVGLYKQQSLFKDRKLAEGDKFTYLSFEPSINLVLKTDVVAKGYRETEIKGTKGKKKLLLVESIPERVEFKSGPDKVEKIQLPVSQMWLDENFEPIKTEVEIPGLGPIVTYRTTKANALAPGLPAQLTDLGFSQLVKLKNRILNPHDTTAAVYRITVRNDDNAATTFAQDERQQAKKVQGNTFELHVRASRGGVGEGQEKEPSSEFTQSSYFINSADAKVKVLARQAVGAETDAWKKSLKIERFVHDQMHFANHEALATSDHVARTLEGDCTEYAMLTAAMCRAEGVPSRTAIGLIYADVKQTPVFAFHMWTEVWIKGRWIAIDATLGKGYVGAAHLKITDHSWHDERTMTPIFPVIRVVGRVSIDVVSAENR